LGGQGPTRTWSPKDGMLKNLIVETIENGKPLTKYTFHLIIIGSEKVDGREI